MSGSGILVRPRRMDQLLETGLQCEGCVRHRMGMAATVAHAPLKAPKGQRRL